MMCSTDEQQWQESGWNGAGVLQEHRICVNCFRRQTVRDTTRCGSCN